MIKNLIYKIGYKRFFLVGILLGFLSLYFYLSKPVQVASNEAQLNALRMELFALSASFFAILFLFLSFILFRAKDTQRVVEVKPIKQPTLIILLISLILPLFFGIVGIIIWISSKPVSEVELNRIEGFVIECNKRGNGDSGDMNFKISSSSLSFKYLNWYPNNRLVYSSIKEGKQIQIWYSLKNPQDSIASLWQISNGRDTLMSYVEMSGKRKLNRYAALAIIIFSFGAIFYTVYKWLRANQALKLTE